MAFGRECILRQHLQCHSVGWSQLSISRSNGRLKVSNLIPPFLRTYDSSATSVKSHINTHNIWKDIKRVTIRVSGTLFWVFSKGIFYTTDVQNSAKSSEARSLMYRLFSVPATQRATSGRRCLARGKDREHSVKVVQSNGSNGSGGATYLLRARGEWMKFIQQLNQPRIDH